MRPGRGEEVGEHHARLDDGGSGLRVVTSDCGSLPARSPSRCRSTQQTGAASEVPMLDPWVPPAVKAKAAAGAQVEPSQGAMLRSQAEAKLKARFDAAAGEAGTLTREQAAARGLGADRPHRGDRPPRRRAHHLRGLPPVPARRAINYPSLQRSTSGRLPDGDEYGGRPATRAAFLDDPRLPGRGLLHARQAACGIGRDASRDEVPGHAAAGDFFTRRPRCAPPPSSSTCSTAASRACAASTRRSAGSSTRSRT